jgi:hypothetical protein
MRQLKFKVGKWVKLDLGPEAKFSRVTFVNVKSDLTWAEAKKLRRADRMLEISRMYE